MPATSTAGAKTSRKATAPRTAGTTRKAAAAKAVPRTEPVDLPAPAGKKGKGLEKRAEKEKLAKVKPPKIKLVRDSFTMPETEYAVLGEVKKECLKAGIAVKKSELLRVGVSLVRKLDINALANLVAALPVLKAGRPKKDK